MSLVISGASGQLARGVINALLETVDASELILVTRTPDAVDVPGAQVRHGDWEQPGTLRSAFAGGEKLLLISGPKVGDRVPGHKAAIDAAVAAGIRWIAYTSIVNPSDSNPIFVAAEHRATEEHLRASGVAWTMLRNSIYADVQVPAMQAALAAGRHVSNAGDGRTSFVAREDCARAAAAVMTSDGHEGREYDITGPEALSPSDLARLFSEVGGKPVEAELIDDDAYTRHLVERVGMPEPVAKVYTTFGTGARRGYSAPVSTTFKELTGREPRTLRSVLEAAA